MSSQAGQGAVLDSLILTLVWTFNIAAVVLTRHAHLLRRVVLASWDLFMLLVAAELAWSLWALFTGQPAVVCMAVCWLGINLLVTARLARRYAAELSPRQIVLLCSWWLGLLAMVARAISLAGLRESL